MCKDKLIVDSIKYIRKWEGNSSTAQMAGLALRGKTHLNNKEKGYVQM